MRKLSLVLLIILIFNFLPLSTPVLAQGEEPSFFALDATVDITGTMPGSAWQDRDVSAYIPEGATGVILHVKNNNTANYKIFGIRKKGSSDSRTGYLEKGEHTWAAIGVDSNRIFQVYGSTYLVIYLVGYTTSGVTFFTNAYDRTPTTINVWEAKDLSDICPNAKGIIVETCRGSIGYCYYGARKYGSTDSRKGYSLGHEWIIIGCDNSQVVEFYTEWTGLKFWVVGYITEGAEFFTNAVDKSISTTSAWTEIDMSDLGVNYLEMVFIECYMGEGEGEYDYGLRKKGETGADASVIGKMRYHHWGYAAVNEDKKIEGYISDTIVDFYVVGYAIAETPPPPPTDFTATPGNLQISLTWKKIEGVSHTHIRYLEGTTPPANTTAGTEIYNDTEESYVHTDLINGTTYSYSAWGRDGATGSFSDTYVSATATCGVPIVVNLDPSNITETAARLNGEVTSVGGENSTAYIYWGDSNGGTAPENWDHVENLGTLGVGTFYKDVTSLSTRTQYFYRCYAVNTYGGHWADSSMSFYTLWGDPAITTLAANPVEKTTATLRADLTDTGGSDLDVATVKFYWGDNDGETNINNWDSVETVTEQSKGIVEKAIIGLTVETTYYYRAFVENAGEKSAWASNTVSFTTQKAGTPTPITEDVTNVTSTGATLKVTLQDDGGAECVIWVNYGPDQSCEFHTGYLTGAHSSDSFSEDIGGLTPGTKYFYRAAANNEHGTGYGIVKFFVTEGAGLVIPRSTSIRGIKIFRDISVTNDRLVLASYNIDYEVEPNEPAEHYYYLYFCDEGGSPLYYNRVISYGWGFAALYLSPEHSFTWESLDYGVMVVSTMGDAEEGKSKATHSFTLGDYDTNLKNIKPFTDESIRYVEKYQGIGMLSLEGLNDIGLDYCEKALPGFSNIYPYPYVPTYKERDYTQSYSSELANRWDGTPYGSSINTLASYVGLSPMWFTSMGWLGLILVICVIIVAATRSAKPALLLSIPMLTAGALLGFLPLVVSILIGFGCILGIGYLFFYKPSAE